MKLLILGAYNTEIEIVNAAKKQGYYTIVTDNHLDYNLAPAKKIADEAWNISFTDLDALVSKCQEVQVDGIMAGFSELRVLYATKLAEKLYKPFYANGSNIDTIISKDEFKNACEKSGLEVAKRYKIDDANINFPVIIKPVDNGGGRGITVCYNIDELKKAYDNAMNFSFKKEAIIEEYLTGDEVMIYYTVHNNHVTLSAMCDRFMHKFSKNTPQLPIGYLFPSQHLDFFIRNFDGKYKQLINDLHIKNGLIAFQSFVTNDKVVPFDPTYRLDGTMAYHIVEKINNINVLDMLVKQSITGSMGDDKEILKKENPHFNKIAFELPLHLKTGIIREIKGIDGIRKLDNVIFIYENHEVGNKIENAYDFTNIVCRIQMIAETKSELKTTIKEIYKLIHVFDQNGEEMVINDVDLVLKSIGN